MKGLLALIIALSLASCATVPQAKAPTKISKKHVEPCPCSPTANQVVQKRWFGGWKFFH